MTHGTRDLNRSSYPDLNSNVYPTYNAVRNSNVAEVILRRYSSSAQIYRTVIVMVFPSHPPRSCESRADFLRTWRSTS